MACRANRPRRTPGSVNEYRDKRNDMARRALTAVPIPINCQILGSWAYQFRHLDLVGCDAYKSNQSCSYRETTSSSSTRETLLAERKRANCHRRGRESVKQETGRSALSATTSHGTRDSRPIPRCPTVPWPLQSQREARKIRGSPCARRDATTQHPTAREFARIVRASSNSVPAELVPRAPNATRWITRTSRISVSTQMCARESLNRRPTRLARSNDNRVSGASAIEFEARTYLVSGFFSGASG